MNYKENGFVFDLQRFDAVDWTSDDTYYVTIDATDGAKVVNISEASSDKPEGAAGKTLVAFTVESKKISGVATYAYDAGGTNKWSSEAGALAVTDTVTGSVTGDIAFGAATLYKVSLTATGDITVATIKAADSFTVAKTKKLTIDSDAYTATADGTNFTGVSDEEDNIVPVLTAGGVSIGGTGAADSIFRGTASEITDTVTAVQKTDSSGKSVLTVNTDSVEALTDKDVFTIGENTYTVSGNYVVATATTGGALVASYKVTEGNLAETTKFNAGTDDGFTAMSAGAITINADTATVSYATDGTELPAGHSLAKVVYNASAAPKTLTISADLTGTALSAGITISGVAVQVTDGADSPTLFNIGTDSVQVKATKSSAFAVDATGQVTATGTLLTVGKGDLKAIDPDGKFDLATGSGSETPTVTFAAGSETENKPSGATITVTGGTITLTETANTTDTVISKAGSVTGLDAAGVVAGVPADATVQTDSTASGEYTVNGKYYHQGATAAQMTITALASGSKLTEGTVLLTAGNEDNATTPGKVMDAAGNVIALTGTGMVEVKADGTLNTALAAGQTIASTGDQANSFAVVGSYVTVKIGDADAVTYLADDLADTKGIDVDAASFTKPDGWNSVEFAAASATDVTLDKPTSADMKIFASAATTSGTVYFKVEKTADSAYTLTETSDASGFTGTLDVTAFDGSTLTVAKANLTGTLKISDDTSISGLTVSGDTFTIGTDGKVTGVTDLTLAGTKLDSGTAATVTVGSAATYTINSKAIVVAAVGTNSTVQIKTDTTTVTEVVLDDANDKITGFDGTYKINGTTITLSGDDAVDVTFDGTDLVISNLASGATVKVGDNSFISTGVDLTITTDGKLKAGTVTVKDTLALSGANGDLTVSGANDGVTVVVSSGTAQNVTDLEPTEIVSYNNKTYQAVSDTILSIKDNTGTKLYDISEITPATTMEALDVLTQDLSGLTPVDAVTDGSWATTSGSYSMAGVKGDTPVAFTVTNASASSSTPTVTVTSAVTAGVFDLTTTAAAAALSSVTFKDSDTGTVYKLSDESSVKLNGTLTASKDGVLTSGSGTVAAASGTITTKTAAPAFDVSQGSTSVVISAGTSLNSTAVTTQVGTVKITESSNTTATTVASDGAVTGIDGSAAITGAATGQTITTTGDGTVSINGTSWTVAGSASGVTYTADADTKGRVSSITGSDGNALTKGTTVSTTDDISGSTVNGITVTSATKGLSITQTEAESASVTLSNSGDEIANASGTFKVNTAGNGVTVASDGTVSGLTDGEKVTVTNGTTTTVYEVTGNTLVTTQTDSSTGTDVTTTYTSILADGETDGFTVALGGKIATNATKEADKTADTTGFTLGGTAVDTVTTDMMVDASGNATTSSEKAVAEVTIQNDGTEIKYTSKQDKKQTVAVTTGTTAANKEWDITTGGGSDVITFAGAKDATINAGDGNNNVTLTNTGDVSVAAGSGNDEITINGTGDALVSVAGGRNVINHTGAGTASIAGGTGNDTISSTNEDDLIYGGAGNNTFQMNAGVTNKISDFTFGADKAALAGVTGTLDAGQVVVDVDGTIAYGDKATSGAIDVSAETFDGYYAVSIADQDGKHKINVGWTGGNGGMINASGLTEKTLLIGNSEGKADTLMGGSAGDTLKAGTGEASLWGGAGNDTLVSGTEASTSFFFLAGDGQDKVQGFKAYTEETKDTADVLDFYGQGISSVMLTDSGIKVTKGTDSMTLVGSYDANTMVQWRSGEASGVAKIGKNAETNSFTYDGAVTNYLGGTKTDTVSVSDDGAGVNVWMDGSRGVGYASIEVLDASSVTGKATLAGGAGSNTITGGTGDSSLWGGADGSDDVLNAGSGTNTFFYGLGNGNDVVNGTKEGDTVNLFNLNLSDLTSAVIEDSKITVTQANGQTLTVNGQANTFTLADGTTWRADHSTKTWSQAQ